ncbi:regulatory LuxR family protein [Kribbella sp. VKM Ac-2569]|uniref:response regulator transcription factor n=1 Tax=Kribbella sp. VKM Ac-2569 TaxID=2512220 RepID=UPI00102C3100|nr:LuxR C-terminal-related transcriptional regulator [Kribbella sp. VKM Ac-2569]RZT19900.1 regulatory LuxR family protein [Kribbella sp. VKM Ac-2569]
MSVYPAVEAVRLEAIQDQDGAPEVVCEVYELGSHRRTPAAVRELTSRQVTIGRMMSTGAKDAAIARDLGLSLRTVRSEISALIAGLGARSRFQAGCLLVRRFG